MRSTRGRRKGPYRFIQNRSQSSVVALKGNAASEKSLDQLSREEIYWFARSAAAVAVYFE